MAVIEKGRQLKTLINVFTLKPDKQAELLLRATEETVTRGRQAPSRGR